MTVDYSSRGFRLWEIEILRRFQSGVVGGFPPIDNFSFINIKRVEPGTFGQQAFRHAFSVKIFICRIYVFLFRLYSEDVFLFINLQRVWHKISTQLHMS